MVGAALRSLASAVRRRDP